MKKINNWVERRKKEQEVVEIESTIHAVLKWTKKLPYEKQVEVVQKIKQSMEATKIAFEDEVKEINKCLIKINSL